MSSRFDETISTTVTIRHGDQLITLPVDFNQTRDQSGRPDGWVVGVAPDGVASVDRLLWLPQGSSAHAAISGLLTGIVEVWAEREARLAPPDDAT